MIEFKDKFIADALDVLSEIEETLLTCEENKVESASIETVFRGLHTLKGASGMYGFKNIEHLMHLIENVYDLIRAGKIELKKGIIDLTFLVVDHVASVLKLDDPRDEEQDFHTKKLENEISALLEFVSTGNTITVGSANKISVIAGVRTCYIRFPEDADFAMRGISPQDIIGSLEELGTVVVRGFDYNADEKLWEVFLVTKESVDDVEDAFMFIADIVEFQTVAPINIFEIKSIADLIQTNTNRNLPHSLNEIKDLYKAHSEADIQEKKIKQKTAQNQKGLYLRVASEKLDEQMNLLSELVTAKAELKLITNREKYKKINKVVETIDKISDRFRRNILNIRLIPIKSIYVSIRRMVRDISVKLDKEIEFNAEGMETELDKNIIDKIETPLTHIIRNAIDHGIESHEVRRKLKKPLKGAISLVAYHSATHIFIEVRDDGGGIDKDKIRQKALEKGLITPDTVLSDKELYDLIFVPGFSTAQNLSEVSGRGVGMDIVKKSIDQLRGEIEIESQKNVGTSMIIKLPLTLSIIDTMLVKSGDQFFSIPLNVISHCTQVTAKEIAENINSQINMSGDLLPYIHLRKVFGMPESSLSKERVVVIQSGKQQVGLIVDKVIGEHQAVLKPLGEFFMNQKYFSGVSILADGHLSVILDTAKLIQDQVSKRTNAKKEQSAK